MLNNKIVTLTFNFTASVRHDSMENRPYLVVPVVMMVEGVHNGSDGPLYYPEEELAKTPQVWNHKPVVVYHPNADTACDPDILTTSKVGVLMNTKFEDGKLKAEAWLEESRLKEVDERVLNAIEQGEIMEVSTGLFLDADKIEGTWNDEEYIGIARNYRPDHLALLPDMKGACSVNDGAGLLRNNERKEDNKKLRFVRMIDFNFEREGSIQNEMGHEELRTKLYQVLRNSIPSDEEYLVYLEDVYEDYIIYERNGSLYKQEYSVNKKSDEVSFNGVPVSVKRTITYSQNYSKNIKKGIDMNKNKVVDALIKNEHTKWKEEDRDMLMELDEKVLNGMDPVIPDPPTKDDDDNKDADIPSPEDAMSQNAESAPQPKPKKVTMNEYLSNTPEEFRPVINDMTRAYNASKRKLIDVITANERNSFTKEQLEKKDLQELEALAQLAAPEPTENSSYDFSGQGEPARNGNMPEPLEMATINWSGENKE